MNETPRTAPPVLGYRAILHAVWPIVLANASAPLLGLADTAVLGRLGSVTALAAVALGSLVLSFVAWGFGFLRMTTTGFVAQADGADDGETARTALARALIMGLVFGTLLFLLRGPIASVALALLDGSAAVEREALQYIRIRLWGAPAALATYALVGTLIGMSASRRLLAVQVAINGINIALDLVFAGALGMGATGVALGTAIAEWVGLGLALYSVWGVLRARWPNNPNGVARERLLDVAALRETVIAQLDIMVRTILLLCGFAWFTNQGARFGDTTLAANHILLQIVSFSAFVLDGFAFSTESLVGRARGATSVSAFDAAVRKTSELAVMAAVVLMTLVWATGSGVIAALTDIESVRTTAAAYLPYAGVYVGLSVAAFQLDGIFIGATRTRAMRNGAAAALGVFLVAALVLVPRWDNVGLWVAFIVYVIARAVALGSAYPSLRRSITAER